MTYRCSHCGSYDAYAGKPYCSAACERIEVEAAAKRDRQKKFFDAQDRAIELAIRNGASDELLLKRWPLLGECDRLGLKNARKKFGGER